MASRGSATDRALTDPDRNGEIVERQLANREPIQNDLVFDSFTGAGELGDHTPDIDEIGDGWVGIVGDWQIADGKATVETSVDQNEFAFIDYGRRNSTIECDVTYGADDIFHFMGIFGAGAEVPECLYFYYAKGLSKLYIGTFGVGGTSKDYGWNPGETKRMRLAIETGMLSGFIDDSLELERETADYPGNTLAGILQRGCSNNKWDNFRVFD